MSKPNTILIIVIVAVFAVLAYFGFRTWREKIAPAVNVPAASDPAKRFIPMPIVNKGKESEDRDAAMEADVRKIASAVKEYAGDHKGAYPLSDLKNPCRGVRICLKGVNINSQKKAYLDPIPQIPPSGLDYHYTADNIKKTYCVKTPHILETDNTKIFQCVSGECGRVEFDKACQ